MKRKSKIKIILKCKYFNINMLFRRYTGFGYLKIKVNFLLIKKIL